jgi:hypothetical protein
MAEDRETETETETAAPAEASVALVTNALQVAREDGPAGLSIALIANETALEVPEVIATVEHLREGGAVAEVEPGEFRWRKDDDAEPDIPGDLPAEDPPADPGDGKVSREAARTELRRLGVPDAQVDELLGSSDDASPEAEALRARIDSPALPAVAAVEVRLPLEVAQALDAAVLGEMVAKGLEQAAAQSKPFRLIVGVS